MNPIMTDELIISIAESISNGNTEEARYAIDEAVESGYDRKKLVKEITDVSTQIMDEKFINEEIFLPTLVKSSEFISRLTDEVYGSTENDDRKTIIIGTAQGDIHEIGKNICGSAVKCRGYKVVDLGCDVNPGQFIISARNNNADAIAVSAPMTTTRPVQRMVIEQKNTELEDISVLVGGAACSQKWADSIGADGYSGNWKEFTELVNRIIGD